jgi:hypothetical protein
MGRGKIMEHRGSEGWLILRMAGKNTLAVAEHLASGGFSVWAPSRVVSRRSPRRKTVREITSPILPSFVFADSSHLHALLILSEAPSKSCPDFSIFRHNREIPVIPRVELEPLRFIEKMEADRQKKRQRNGKALAFSTGEVVRINNGSFAGLSGVVESDDGRFAEVSFGSFKVKISTFLLRDDMAQHQDIAALADLRA